MSEQEDRLIRCFASVFPELSPEEIRTINSESTGNWDSLSTVTLAAVVQEEFNVEIEPDVLPELTSFEAFQGYLQRIKTGREVSEGQ
jgi:acyl carrier protein